MTLSITYRVFIVLQGVFILNVVMLTVVAPYQRLRNRYELVKPRGGFHRGVRYLMGENLKVVWAEFSTVNEVVSPNGSICAWQHMSIAYTRQLLEMKTQPRFCPVG